MGRKDLPIFHSAIFCIYCYWLLTDPESAVINYSRVGVSPQHCEKGNTVARRARKDPGLPRRRRETADLPNREAEPTFRVRSGKGEVGYEGTHYLSPRG
jgi:hypothetical protein